MKNQHITQNSVIKIPHIRQISLVGIMGEQAYAPKNIFCLREFAKTQKKKDDEAYSRYDPRAQIHIIDRERNSLTQKVHQ